jgi:peroxiredoxin
MQQLAAFQHALDRLTDEGIRVVAASTDPLEKAEETVGDQSITFPVGYIAGANAASLATGWVARKERSFNRAMGAPSVRGTRSSRSSTRCWPFRRSDRGAR